jgi:hypothetical protein
MVGSVTLVTLKDGRVCKIARKIRVFHERKLRTLYEVIQSVFLDGEHRFDMYQAEIIRPGQIERIGD